VVGRGGPPVAFVAELDGREGFVVSVFLGLSVVVFVVIGTFFGLPDAKSSSKAVSLTCRRG